MARNPRILKVAVTPRALRDLNGIWIWNAEHYGVDHAEAYVAFLRKGVSDLGQTYASGRSMAFASDCFYINLRKSRRGQSFGHVVIYQVVDNIVTVLRVFHAREDWQGKLERGES